MTERGDRVLEHRDCVERLPWYLAGTLEETEAGAVEVHLRVCERCREELEATRAAARLFAEEHTGPTTLVALAWGELAPGRAQSVEAHVATCPDCREELALARASRGLEAAGDDPRVAPMASRPGAGRGARWPLTAAAAVACVALALGAFGAWRAARTRADLDRMAERVRAAEAAVESVDAAREEAEVAGRRIHELEQRIAGLLAPHAGLAVIELLPAMAHRGSGGFPSVEAVRGPGPFLVVLLVLERPRDFDRYTVDVRGAEGNELWSISGVEPDAGGALALLAPAALLPAGPVRFEVEGVRGAGTVPVAVYRLLLRSAPAEPAGAAD